ncbi:MAG: hypothetical protein HONBIEJF_02106 [Fimbriimonadaceae bacterium]|nr:hypothetical protein [Fimbriimonadaceae bacterium]
MEPTHYDLDPDLARVNVLRMRGDFDAAKDHCLAVLRKAPENETANLLMGDICAEAGDMRQAEDWYRIALDIDPHSVKARKKLDGLIAAKAVEEIASAEQQIGVPVNRGPNQYLFPTLLGLFVLFVIALAYLIGRKMRDSDTQPLVIRSPRIEIPASPPAARMAPEVPEATSGNSSEDPDAKPALKASTELDIREALELADRQHIQEIRINPSTRAVHITLRKLPIDEERDLSARTIVSVLERLVDIPRVLIYVTRDGQSVSAADVKREAFDALPRDNGVLRQPVADHLLPENWPLAEPEPVGDATTGSPTPPTTGG